MTDSSATAQPPGEISGHGWLARNGWMLAALWLVFLVFPLIGILTGDGSNGVKALATMLLLAFATVYLDGFRRQHRREQQAALDPGYRGGQWTGSQGFGGDARWIPSWIRRRGPGLGHFLTLVVLAAALIAVAGIESIAILAFVVVFAVFNFPWPVVSGIYGFGIGAAIFLLVLAGRLSELWPMVVIVSAVGGAAVLVRLVEGFQFDQAHLRTGLAVGDERTRVARDVHDVLGHNVTAVILKVELCQRLLDKVDTADASDTAHLEECRRHLTELESIGRTALAEIRSTVGGLRATNLADEVTAARSVLADAGVELLVTGDVAEIPEAMRPTLAWVVREAVTNIVRHAEATRCHIELGPGIEGTLLRLSDDGVGLEGTEEGNGLRGLRERVSASGAFLRVESATIGGNNNMPEAGTRIEVAL